MSRVPQSYGAPFKREALSVKEFCAAPRLCGAPRSSLGKRS
jgi:hypothetical protein